ncbi:MAG: CAP domain-containing protein [Henriciella sp.]
MLRFLSIFVGAVLASLPAFACEMSAEDRSTALTAYVENGTACLENLPDTFRFDLEAEKQFEREINKEREKAGLKRLKVRAETRPAARFHSLDMGVNAFFAHQSPDGFRHGDRIAAFDRRLVLDRSAENVAQFGPAVCTDQNDQVVSCLLLPGFELPTRNHVVEHLHKELMQSEGHRENILDPEVTHMAVGVSRSDTGFYVTQLFVSVVGTFEAPLPLAFEAGQSIEADLILDDWETYQYAIMVEGDPQDLKNNKLPRDVSGEVGVNVRAERVVEDGKRKSVFWIYLSGPKITVTSAKES